MQQQAADMAMHASEPDKITPSKAKTAASPVTIDKRATAKKKAATATAKVAAATKQTRVSKRIAAKKK